MEGLGQAIVFMLLLVSIIVSIPALIMGLLGWHFAKKKDSHSNNISTRAALLIIGGALITTLIIIAILNQSAR